jgi:hypothetical protein
MVGLSAEGGQSKVEELVEVIRFLEIEGKERNIKRIECGDRAGESGPWPIRHGQEEMEVRHLILRMVGPVKLRVMIHFTRSEPIFRAEILYFMT